MLRSGRTVCVVTRVLARERLAIGDLCVERRDGGRRAADEGGARVDRGVRRGAGREADGVAVHREPYEAE